MNIIQAKDNDFIDILFVVKQCLKEKQGLFIGNKLYAESELSEKIKKDIEDQVLFIYREHESCIALIALGRQHPGEYLHISWNDNSAHFLSIQNLIVHPHWQQKNIAEKLLLFAESFSIKQGYSSLRFCTSNLNEPTGKLFEKAKFIRTGHLPASKQNMPCDCYEKILLKIAQTL